MGCLTAFTALFLQWPSRRSVLCLTLASYCFWIALVHHQASTWMRADIAAVAEFIAPFERIAGPKGTWMSFIAEAQGQETRSATVLEAEASGYTSSHDEQTLVDSNMVEREVDRVEERLAPLANDTAPNATKEAVNMSAESTHHFSTVLQSETPAPECLPMQLNEITYTLVSQCDDNRLDMVAQHCSRWSGPMSVAIYTSRSADDVMADLVALGCIEKYLHVGTLDPSQTLSEDSYPVNHLRNIALRSVETSHILYMDVDFLPSGDMAEILESSAIRQALADDHKHALVIPAFEYKPKCQNCSTHDELLSRMPRSKNELMLLHDEGEASMFHEYWPVAHDSTDYAMWKHQEHGSLLPISCIRSNHYEPYLVIRKCQEMPQFQEAFTGYGHNKASFTMQLQAMAYRLSQVGGVFCTHFPHEASKARQLFDEDKEAKKGRRLEIMELVKNYTAWLKATYGHIQPEVPNCKSTRKSSASTPVQSTEGSASNQTSLPEATQFFEDSQSLDVCKDLAPEEITYSLVTQCSDDRLWMMEHHCQRWGVNNSYPHISLVVYTNETLSDIKTKLVALGCQVDRGLTVQTFPRIYEDKDYPVNYFRNEALAAVNTSHALFLDVDFWPSNDLFSTLDAFEVRSKLSESTQNAINVPAFQLLSRCKKNYFDCPDKNIPFMSFVKDDSMRWRLDHGSITPFNYIHNKDGHGSTRFDWWADEELSKEVLEIDCVKSNRYEPYLVVRVCRELPPFQPVFKGYGKNKISWILHLRRLGWRFFQRGQGFVIHYPHKDSNAKRAWKGGSVRGVKEDNTTVIFEDSMRSQNDKYFVEFRQWLAGSVPNRTKVHKCTEGGVSQDDDAALWVTRDSETPVAF